MRKALVWVLNFGGEVKILRGVSGQTERISKIVLSGGCAQLAGLDEFLSSSWGIPVELARPFQSLQVDGGRFPAAELERLGPTLAVAVGLGMRRPGDKPA